MRRYARRAGRAMLVEVRSLADVKLVGPTEFVMSYEYQSVDGHAAHESQPTLMLTRTVDPPTPR
jgi:hypothetical protein